MQMSVLYITSILLLQDLSTFYIMDHSSPVMLRSLLYLLSTLSVYSYQQCVATHHVPKCMSCHKAIFSYVMDIYCIYIYCKTLKYKLIVYLCRFKLLILHVLHILIWHVPILYALHEKESTLGRQEKEKLNYEIGFVYIDDTFCNLITNS